MPRAALTLSLELSNSDLAELGRDQHEHRVRMVAVTCGNSTLGDVRRAAMATRSIVGSTSTPSGREEGVCSSGRRLARTSTIGSSQKSLRGDSPRGSKLLEDHRGT